MAKTANSTLRGGRKEEKEKQAPHTTKTFKKINCKYLSDPASVWLFFHSLDRLTR